VEKYSHVFPVLPPEGAELPRVPKIALGLPEELLKHQYINFQGINAEVKVHANSIAG